jgi:hypothetical protein
MSNVFGYRRIELHVAFIRVMEKYWYKLADLFHGFHRSATLVKLASIQRFI